MDMYEVSELVLSLFFCFKHFISKGTFHHFSFKLAPGKTCNIWTVSCCQPKLPPFHHISVISTFFQRILMMTKTEHVIIFSYPGQFRNTISRHSMPNDSTKNCEMCSGQAPSNSARFFPDRSSAQNSSGVHWCRRRVRFNRVPEEVPQVLEKVWETLVQSQVRFNRGPEKSLAKVGEALVQSQVTFNRVAEKVQTGFRRRFRKRSGRFWCRASAGSTGFAAI